MLPSADYWIEHLRLTPHPEGGYCRETYRSAVVIEQQALPARFAGARCASTAIYFLLRSGQVSALHRLSADEIWHFYCGAPLALYRLSAADLTEEVLGPDPAAGQSFQTLVPAGVWVGAESQAGGADYTLFGCTVAPGFEYEDFELADRAQLLQSCPQYESVIERLCPPRSAPGW